MEYDPDVVKFFSLLQEHGDISVRKFFELACNHNHLGRWKSPQEVYRQVEENPRCALDMCVSWCDVEAAGIMDEDTLSDINRNIYNDWDELHE